MTTATTSVEETLNGLIEICRDGQQGFDAAVSSIENGELKTELREFSRHWSEFAAQLSGAMEQMGRNRHWPWHGRWNAGTRLLTRTNGVEWQRVSISHIRKTANADAGYRRFGRNPYRLGWLLSI